jgi:nitrate/nitrite transport system ATP-binding protein
MTMSDAFLQLDGVCKGYGKDPRAVLRDVHLEIAKRELVAIVGRSGCGKSTLLSLIAGLTRASQGVVRLHGEVVTRPGPERAVVFQNYSLLPWLTVHDNIKLAVDGVHRDWSVARRRERTDEWIALVGLTPAREKRPAQLSGGMRQRVSLARALAMEPQLLLMDEPLAAVDALTRGTLQDEIERIWLRDHTTALLVTNDVDEAIRLADRIIPLGTVGGMPGATLGESIAVDFARPRDRVALTRDPRFLALRAQVITRLRGVEHAPVVVDPATVDVPLGIEVAA